MGMSNRTVQRPQRHDDVPTTTALHARGTGGSPLRTASLVAGVALVVMAALSGFGVFVAVGGLVTPGDATATARDVVASEGMFRLGIASLLMVIALDVVVAWGLFRVFAHVDLGVSRLAAWLRLAYAGVFMVAVTELMGALRLLGDHDYLAVFTADQRHAQALLRINAFTDVFDAGLVLFGLHLIVVGCLALRSSYVPSLLGALLVIAGLGYLFDSFAAALGGSTNVAAFTFLGEFLLALWLVIRRRRLDEVSANGDVAGARR